MLPLITVGIILVIGLTWWCGGTEPASQCRRYGFHPWIGKIPWKRKWQPTPAFLPGESHGQRNLVGYSPWDCKKSEMTDPPPTHTHHISPPISSRLHGTRTLPDGENSPGIRFAHTVFEHEEASVDPGAVRPGTVTYQPLAEKAAYGWLEGQVIAHGGSRLLQPASSGPGAAAGLWAPDGQEGPGPASGAAARPACSRGPCCSRFSLFSHQERESRCLGRCETTGPSNPSPCWKEGPYSRAVVSQARSSGS